MELLTIGSKYATDPSDGRQCVVSRSCRWDYSNQSENSNSLLPHAGPHEGGHDVGGNLKVG